MLHNYLYNVSFIHKRCVSGRLWPRLPKKNSDLFLYSTLPRQPKSCTLFTYSHRSTFIPASFSPSKNGCDTPIIELSYVNILVSPSCRICQSSENLTQKPEDSKPRHLAEHARTEVSKKVILVVEPQGIIADATLHPHMLCFLPAPLKPALWCGSYHRTESRGL
jgi:hypothetical protein